jgi:hypothetical protein
MDLIDSTPCGMGSEAGILPVYHAHLSVVALVLSPHVWFGVFEALSSSTMAHIAVISGAVSGLEMLIGPVFGVRLPVMVIAPVCILHGGINLLGDAFADQTTGKSTYSSSNRRTYWTSENSSNYRCGSADSRRSQPCADRMSAGGVGERIAVCVVIMVRRSIFVSSHRK